MFSGEGQEAMLVCIVHGEAQPDVSSNMLLCNHHDDCGIGEVDSTEPTAQKLKKTYTDAPRV